MPPIGATPISILPDTTGVVCRPAPRLSSPPATPPVVLSTASELVTIGEVVNSRGITTRTSAVRTIARTSRFSIYQITGSGNRVESTRSEWITAGNTTHRKPASSKYTMALESLDGVCRTAWIVATCSGKQGGEYHLIASHHSDEHCAHHGGISLHPVTRRTPVITSVRSSSKDAS